MCQVIAIVDHPDSHHGRQMSQWARGDGFSPVLRWVPPSLQLPETLAGLDGVGAVVVPLGVRRATPRDRFTRRLIEAIDSLGRRGIPVFVAAGNRRVNILARAGTAVSVEMSPGSLGTSEACIRAAVRALYRPGSRDPVHPLE